MYKGTHFIVFKKKNIGERFPDLFLQWIHQQDSKNSALICADCTLL